MSYVVFEDLQSKNKITKPEDTPVKIHKITSSWYINRKVDATTVRWHGPFNTSNEAEACAKQTGKPWKWDRGAKDNLHLELKAQAEKTARKDAVQRAKRRHQL